jgi:hypothetical protein
MNNTATDDAPRHRRSFSLRKQAEACIKLRISCVWICEARADRPPELHHVLHEQGIPRILPIFPLG